MAIVVAHWWQVIKPDTASLLEFPSCLLTWKVRKYPSNPYPQNQSGPDDGLRGTRRKGRARIEQASMHRREFLSATALALYTLGCGSPSSLAGLPGLPAGQLPGDGNFVGRIQGTDFFLGITRNSQRFFAYLCDSLRAQRFEGDLLGDSGRLPEFSLVFQNGRATGTVRIDGIDRAFEALPAYPPQGLYWAQALIDKIPYFGGWILDQGQEKGVVSRVGTPLTLAGPVPQPTTSIIAILIGLRQPVLGPPPAIGGLPLTATTNIQDGPSNITDGSSNT